MILDIDRHILLEIAMYSDRRKKCFEEFAKYWSDLIDCSDRGDLLYWTECSDDKKKQKELKKIRRKFFSSVKNLSLITTKILVYSIKQDTMLEHLVGEVKVAVTNKDKERKNERKR